jgi:hypothetical protein
MRYIDIDFVRRPRRPVIELVLLFAALILLTDRILDWHALDAENEQSLTRIAGLEDRLRKQARQRTLHEKAPDPQLVRQQTQDGKVLTALTYPWAQVLSIVEKPDVQDVTLLAFNHDIEVRQGRLIVEAKDIQSLGKYVEQLNQASADSLRWRWYIASYQLQQQNSPATVKATVLTGESPHTVGRP